jgi:tRNA pseudouridine38-40 synthase
LERILGEQVRCEAASRTDRGVHAIGQVVQFQAVKQVSELQRALNGHLPRDIRVLDVKAVGPDFHPTLDAKSKIYHYYVHQGSVEDPFYSKISWHYRHPLDLEKMRVEATKLIGTHDFSRFTTEVRNHSICTLFEIELIPLPENRLKISLTGDRFLYKMARRICGTLVQIGAGKIPPDTVGVTAPPHGLFLYKINYL